MLPRVQRTDAVLSRAKATGALFVTMIVVLAAACVPAAAAAASFTARGSAEQVDVTGAKPGSSAEPRQRRWARSSVQAGRPRSARCCSGT